VRPVIVALSNSNRVQDLRLAAVAVGCARVGQKLGKLPEGKPYG
jgi:hypothetical protein